MRKTISTYWPVAMLVPIALAGYLHTVGADQPSAAPHAADDRRGSECRVRPRDFAGLRRCRRRLAARRQHAGSRRGAPRALNAVSTAPTAGPSE